MQKLYSTFPDEWPGIGLLLLRGLVGCSLMVQGMSHVQMPSPSLMACCLAALMFTVGAFLLAGLMTHLAALVVALGEIGITLSRISLPSQDLFYGSLAMISLIVVSIAIAMLGPGAFSLDAWMFGRREITIPSHSSHKKAQEAQ